MLARVAEPEPAIFDPTGAGAVTAPEQA